MLRTRSPELDDSPQAQLAQARQVLLDEARALTIVSERLGDELVVAVETIADCVGVVHVTGMGKAGIIAQKTAATFSSTGTRAHFLHPAEAAHGDLGRVGDRDVVLALSHSGETAELTQILGAVKESGARLIGVTSRANSTLAKLADVAVVYGSIEEACPIGMAPSTSCAVMLGIGDAIAFVLMRLREFDHEDFGRFHPAGSLGKKLRSVQEIMRSGPQLRLADQNQSIRDVFVASQKSGRRTGAVILTSEEGKLAGIFTDSDLVRLLERRDEAALDRPIRDYMTRRPITLRLGQRVQDVLLVLKDYHVSEIPVIDSEGRPVGLVDITDLIDLLPNAA